jgi:hypothetical protein
MFGKIAKSISIDGGAYSYNFEEFGADSRFVKLG